MSQNLYDAHRQWAIRPADERFANLEDLLFFTQTQKQISSQAVRPLSSISLGVSPDGGLTMNGSSPFAYFSNWGFGQLCRSITAPASYLRCLPVDLARKCLQHGLERSTEECNVLIRDHSLKLESSGERFVSAFTSASYGRIWDAEVVESLMRAVHGSGWHVPEARRSNNSVNSGLYASDHDMFAFLVNDENPLEVGDAKLGRGFFCWNSETGASTFGLTTFLYNSVCGNHIVWGAENIQGLRIYHRSQAPDRFYGAAIPVLNRFVENRGLDENIKVACDRATNQQVGDTLESVTDWFNGRPFTRKEIASAWETGKAEGNDVTNLWGMVQGLTAHARDLEHIDKRVNLERRAGALLAK
jgi:hypothetical protein